MEIYSSICMGYLWDGKVPQIAGEYYHKHGICDFLFAFTYIFLGALWAPGIFPSITGKANYRFKFQESENGLLRKIDVYTPLKLEWQHGLYKASLKPMHSPFVFFGGPFLDYLRH